MKTSKVHAVSRMSLKIDDIFYTFEFLEERVIEDGDNVDEVVANLWEVVNNEVESQIERVLDGTE